MFHQFLLCQIILQVNYLKSLHEFYVKQTTLICE